MVMAELSEQTLDRIPGTDPQNTTQPARKDGFVLVTVTSHGYNYGEQHVSESTVALVPTDELPQDVLDKLDREETVDVFDDIVDGDGHVTEELWNSMIPLQGVERSRAD